MSNRRYGKVLLGMFLIGIMMCFFYKDASAFGNLLKSSETSVYAGTIVNLRDFVDDTYILDNYGENYSRKEDKQLLSYQFNIANRDEECAALDSDGNLTTKKPGTVIVDIKFSYKNNLSIVPFTVNIMEPEKLNVSYGNTSSIEAASIYDKDNYTFISDKDSVSVNDTGDVTVQGFKSSTIYAKGRKGEKIAVADISVNTPSSVEDVVVRAVGTEPYTPEINDYTSLSDDVPVKWLSDDENVVKVTDGQLEAEGIGNTNVSAVITAKNGDVEKVEVPVTVTNPIMAKSKMVVAVGGKKALALNGTCANSAVKWKKSSSKKVSFTDDGKIFATKKGSDKITFSVDGKEISCNVKVTNPSLKYTNLITYKGGSRKIAVNGTVDGSSMSFTSKNASMAAGTATGVIKAKKRSC